MREKFSIRSEITSELRVKESGLKEIYWQIARQKVGIPRGKKIGITQVFSFDVVETGFPKSQYPLKKKKGKEKCAF